MKQVSEAFRTMAASDMMQTILDRSKNVDDIAPALASHWSYDLYSRRPGAALFENGVLQPTDLDLACFLSALADRGAVINLPSYKSRRASTKREGEIVLSKENRHGPIVGLVSNKSVFSFSVRIKDSNVMIAGDEERGIQDQSGAFRNFMLVDLEGEWHEGWHKIEFLPSVKENDFLNEKGLYAGSTIVFKNFVHPNRWISVYGRHYFALKALIQRLEEEQTHYNKAVKDAISSGLQVQERQPAAEAQPYMSDREVERGESVAKVVTAFECEVDAPWRGEFHPVGKDVVSVALMRDRLHTIRYQTLPELRFAARATELAFYKAGMKDKGLPAWVQGCKWESGYMIKRTAWERLVMTQLLPGQTGFALRYRTYEKTERVAP